MSRSRCFWNLRTYGEGPRAAFCTRALGDLEGESGDGLGKVPVASVQSVDILEPPGTSHLLSFCLVPHQEAQWSGLGEVTAGPRPSLPLNEAPSCCSGLDGFALGWLSGGSRRGPSGHRGAERAVVTVFELRRCSQKVFCGPPAGNPCQMVVDARRCAPSNARGGEDAC